MAQIFAHFDIHDFARAFSVLSTDTLEAFLTEPAQTAQYTKIKRYLSLRELRRRGFWGRLA